MSRRHRSPECAWLLPEYDADSAAAQPSRDGAAIVASAVNAVPSVIRPCAPGWPGIPARWTSSAKSGVGTAVSRDSRVWFTLSHGILNEIYYPRVDHACTRDLGFIVTDGADATSRRKSGTPARDVSQVAPGVPAYRIRNTARRRPLSHREGGTDRSVARRRAAARPFRAARRARWRISACTCCSRRTSPTEAAAIRRGSATTRARRCCSPSGTATRWRWPPRRRGSRDRSGFVGIPMDGRNCTPTRRLVADLRARGERQRRRHRRNRSRRVGRHVRAGPRLRSARRWKPVSTRSSACSRIRRDERRSTSDAWKAWHANRTSRHRATAAAPPLYRLQRRGAARRTNRSASKAASSPACRSRGASPKATTTWAAITWSGRATSSRPAGGFIAIGAHDDARRVLRYLQVTQEADGHWSQNMWLDGTPYWHGIQMDETALPILLVDLAAREGRVDARRARRVVADGAAGGGFSSAMVP